jgi:LuxR family maltose regulon positive regulatory protein
MLVEVDANDLTLDAEGARALLRGAGVDVSTTDADELVGSTEGWPAGLYLAALSLQAQGRSRVPSISFTGDDRFVSEYVRSELLARLPRERVRFLTRTSVLQRLCGPLCDAVTGGKGSASVLDALEQSNLLITPLDRRQEWYRYHRMFRDVLQSELMRREPAVVVDLHRRAADWYEANGLLEDAMEHARSAGDAELVAGLFERQIFPLNRSGRLSTLERWLGYLGVETVARHPSVAVAAAWIAALAGEALAAERWADLALGAKGDWIPSDGSATSTSALAMMRALATRGGPEAMLEDAKVALREEGDSSPWRPAALCLAGIASVTLGDLSAADRHFAEAAGLSVEVGAVPAASLALAERSLIATSRGDREGARAHAERAEEVVRSGHLQEYATSVPTFAAMARVALRAGERARVREALTHAQRVRPSLTYAIPALAVQIRLELARVHLAISDVAGARTLLREIDEILERRPDLGVLGLRVAEFRARLGSLRMKGSVGPSTLTAAELRLLTLLPTHLSFREIGARLFVSPNTVKTQAISIYRKLGVSSRSGAVEAARAVGLLED